MNFKSYQTISAKYAKKSIKKDAAYYAMGLGSETGEVLDKLKKMKRDKDIDLKGVKQELGDVLWYVSQLCTLFDFDLADVAQDNLLKLESRKARDKISGSGDDR